MSFFSLQPSQTQESNLSKFASAAPGLEHVGNRASYLDPSLSGGETLHSPFEDEATQQLQGMQGSNIMRPAQVEGEEAGSVSGEGTQYQSNVTGTQFRVPSGPTSSTQMINTYQQQPQRPQQPESPYSESQIEAMTTIGQVQSGLSKIPASATAAVKNMFKSSPEGANMSDAEIDAFIEYLNDPSLFDTAGALEGNDIYEPLNQSPTEGYTLGAGNLDADWLGEYGDVSETTGTRTPPTTLDKFGVGDINAALGVAQGAISGDPVQIMRSLNTAAPSVAKYITDNQAAVKDVGSVAGVAAGAYSLYKGLETKNPAQIAGGVAQLLQSAGTSRVGLEVIAQLTGTSAGAISTAFSAVGGLTGAYSLYQAVQNGDPVQALFSAASIYGSLSTIAPDVFVPLTTMISDAIVAVAPQVAQSVGLVSSGAATTGATSAAAIAAPLAVAAMVAMAVVWYVGNEEEMAARSSGWWNNPLIGQQYDLTVQGMQSINDTATKIQQVGINNVATDDLMSILGDMNTKLQPYYDYLQGGRGPVSGSAAAGSPGMLNKEDYTAQGENATNAVYQVVQELQRRGVTAEQLATIPGAREWGHPHLGGTAAPAGSFITGGGPGAEAIASGAWLSPEAANTALGGPVGSMLASLNPDLYKSVGGLASYSDPAIQAEIQRMQEYANLINQQSYQDFTSGGG